RIARCVDRANSEIWHWLRSVHAVVAVSLLELERDAHEAHLRLALDCLRTRKPESSLVKTVLDGDGTHVRPHWRNHRLHPARDIVAGVVPLFVRLLGNSHDVHLLGQAIHRPDEMRCGGIEPERADRDVPLRLSWSNAKLAQLDALSPGKLELDRISRLVRVVGLRTGSEGMDYLVLTDISFRQTRANPNRLAPRSVREIAA